MKKYNVIKADEGDSNVFYKYYRHIDNNKRFSQRMMYYKELIQRERSHKNYSDELKIFYI